MNGTTGTVLEAGDRGLTVAVDGTNSRRVVLPAEWVRGTRMDGSPNLSHAWARTVDGARGGTWEAAHLLGTSALDAFRGYVGQSRYRQPTHTWNTTPVIDLDHGGRVADARTADEHVLAALARTSDSRLAAVTDPHRPPPPRPDRRAPRRPQQRAARPDPRPQPRPAGARVGRAEAGVDHGVDVSR